jgi:protocatechuate 3,4-dioxygenase beta subunit
MLAGLAACRLEPSATGQQAEPDAPPQAKAKPGVPTHPITVTGRAVDPAGKPIAGAKIYLASMGVTYGRPAETTTDQDGQYEFRDVSLPIRRADKDNPGGQGSGSFQVFGRAEGFGFAWRPRKWFYTDPKPANVTYEPDLVDPPSRYRAGDPIALDLRFPPAARFSGRVVDERGEPVVGVSLEIRNCESLGFIDSLGYVDAFYRGWSLDVLNERATAPASMKIRTSDAEGRFAFTGMPKNSLLRIDLRATGFPNRRVYAATISIPQPDEEGAPVLEDGAVIVMKAPVAVPVVVLLGDTGEPAPRVRVEAGQGPLYTSGTTDGQGRVTLRMPSGASRLELLPERGTPYLVTEGSLMVGDAPPGESAVERLRPAAIVEVKIVDAETGEGLPDVDLWRRGEGGNREEVYFRSWEVATRTAYVERPRADATGTLRALVEPGVHRFGIAHNFSPKFYVPGEPEGKEVDCRAGETVRVEFSMRKTR